ncbi:hypothetical protein CLV62_101397 [Dysgonomonas alginatilytica]|uniref:Uncharacterized protein n=1 Tax=Dysgonomonas alginatilytica TaxID=1605892 RepID=A0A2V3PX16_9BACT|nr:hypothetical protein [Dysgonomonas alginatilytica]PXV69128.1 hypothetical protein CLV62_101397 [Dysgonomonas alginatilytica]
MERIKVSLVLIFLWLSLISSFGQVGINTENPQSTLDVSGDNSSAAAGIIAPRQTRQQLITKAASYTVNQRGAIVYVTDVTGGTNAATANVTQAGYYYYDGSLWQPFNNSSSSNVNNWSIAGNAGLSATHGTNYLGTTDAVDLVFKTAATERMTINSKGNVGIGTVAPTNKLHVKDTTNPLKVEGLAASASASDLPMVVGSDGIVKTGTFPVVNIVPDDVGTVIAIDGKLLIAQEITVLMTADFVSKGQPTPLIPDRIGNLTNKIIDNKNTFSSTATTNSFKVMADGVYSIMINVQLETTAAQNPVVGIWCDTPEAGFPNGKWVARVNDAFMASGATVNGQTYTLITAIDMYVSKTYSFRVVGNADTTVKAFSRGSTGEGPISFYSLKRLK